MPPTGPDGPQPVIQVEILPGNENAALAPTQSATLAKAFRDALQKYGLPVRGSYPQRLAIPAIELDAPILPMGWSATTNASGMAVSEWDVVDYAAGWHINSAQPGQPGNMVLSGHNTINGSVFRRLHDLHRGDTITVWSGRSQSQTYIVDEVQINPHKYASETQRAENVAYIGPTADDRLTLVTCWPAYGDSHRVIVVAHKE
jgi:sortase A